MDARTFDEQIERREKGLLQLLSLRYRPTVFHETTTDTAKAELLIKIQTLKYLRQKVGVKNDPFYYIHNY